jgi:hypothetical protein
VPDKTVADLFHTMTAANGSDAHTGVARINVKGTRSGLSYELDYVCFITCGLYSQSTSCRIERPRAKTAGRVLVAASLVYSLLLL